MNPTTCKISTTKPVRCAAQSAQLCTACRPFPSVATKDNHRFSSFASITGSSSSRSCPPLPLAPSLPPPLPRSYPCSPSPACLLYSSLLSSPPPPPSPLLLSGFLSQLVPLLRPSGRYIIDTNGTVDAAAGVGAVDEGAFLSLTYA